MSYSYLVLLPFALTVATLVYNRWLHPLSKFPGPYLASHTDLFRLYHLWTGHMPETLVKLHEKYGPVVRYAPNELSFQTPNAIDPIYKNGRKTIKTDFYDGFTTFYPNVFGTRDEEVRFSIASLFSVSCAHIVAAPCQTKATNGS